jgi:O-antigen/teichoic acid export membrane protein
LWRRILASTAMYSVAMLFGRLASFFLLPLYTRYLSPADYGVLEIVDLAMFMLATVIGIGLAGDALFYFHARLPDELSKKRAVQTIILAACAISAVGCIVAQSFAPWFSHWLFRTGIYTPALRIAALAFLVTPPIDALLCYVRAIEKTTAFMLFSLFRLMASITLNIILLVVFKLGLYAILVSTFVVNGLLCLGLFVYCLRSLSGWAGVDWAILRRVVSYSTPIGVSSGAMLLIHYGDRVFLSRYCTLADIGVYALGYKLGMALSYLNLPFQMFWRSQVYSIVDEQDGDRVFVKVFLYFEFVFVISAFVLALFSGLAVRVLSTQAFWGAAAFVPWVAFAYAARALEYQMQSALLVDAKTRKIMVSTLVGVTVCLTGYAFAIPAYGVWGAVLATCLSFTTMLVITFVLAQRQRHFEMPYPKLFTLPVLAFGLYLLRPLFGSGDTAVQILISVVFCIALPAAALAIPAFGEERRLFAEVARRLSARFAG